jgi:Fe-S-cluster-containing dehydrogenase component
VRSGQFGIDDNPVFVIDQSRCIGCEACVQACAECGTHRGQSLIHLERVDRATTTQTAPMVCMHCEDPTCAQVCPADAIKQTEEGIVQSALKPRCIGCSNCVLACPFGVPKYVADFDQMMKCDMCTDRTSEGLTPMCASVCPSEALWYGTIEEFRDTRRGSLFRDFLFGRQQVRTKVYTVIDDALAGPIDALAGATTTWLDDPFGLDMEAPS